MSEAYIERRVLGDDGKSVYHFEAHAGAHISHAVSSALGQLVYKSRMYGHENMRGFLEFNSLQVPLNLDDTTESVCARYQEMSDARRAEYLKSPEYAQQQREAAARLVVNQHTLDKTVNKIKALCAEWSAKSQLHPSGPEGAELFGLLITYIDAADYIGVNKHVDTMRAALKSVGYAENAPHPMRHKKENVVQFQQDYRAFAAGLVVGTLGRVNPHFGPQIEKWELHLHH